MKCKFTTRKTGVVLIIVIGCLIFTMILFASLVNRVRHESQLTMKSSHNEQLYQLASAIGRIAIRKLASDIKTRDENVAEIFQAIFNPSGKQIKKKPFKESIEKLDVISELKSMYKHQKGDLKIEDVSLSIDLDSSFPPEFPGLEPAKFERDGSLDVEVRVSYAGYERKFIVRKQFLLTHLLAPPFYKFTLFSHQGANLSQSEANRLEDVTDMGKVNDSKPPLVLFNRRIKDSSPDQKSLDFCNPQVFNVEKNSFSRNGWVYLGGNGRSPPNGNLTLNIVPGAEKQVSQNFFGEIFHLYYSDLSNGWLEETNWTEWLKEGNKFPSAFIGPEYFIICEVNYGFYTAMKGHRFFKRTLKNLAANSSGDVFDQGSALHLFGTPSLCTPTLVFGKVNRRYYKTHSFLITGRVFPFGYYNEEEWYGVPDRIEKDNTEKNYKGKERLTSME
ncbi:hypothetical protein HYY75_11905 [bacterium]|nr:hypothetical protein [bacterium]